jgi:anaerobic sulfite reductase subunit C
MSLPKTIDLAALKTGGFIKEKEKDLFALRLRVPVGKISADHLCVIGEIAKKYGSGKLHLTVRQGIEIQDIPFSDLQTAREELEATGVRIGACGPRFRVVTACPGAAVCPNGLVDSAGLGLAADERFYGQSEGLDLPHKFKVTFAGCLSCCPKPQENDIGFHGQVEPELHEDECNGCGICEVTCKEGAITMGDNALPVRDEAKCTYCGDCIKSCPTDAWKIQRTGLAAYAGGRWGRHPELGKKIADFVAPDQAMDMIAGVLKFYKDAGRRGERLGVTINRVGLDELKRRVL